MSPMSPDQRDEAREIGREIAEQLTPPHGTPAIDATENKSAAMWSKAAAIVSMVALAGALIGWVMSVSARADAGAACCETTKLDHDKGVALQARLDVLLPRLEAAVNRLEKQADTKGAK